MNWYAHKLLAGYALVTSCVACVDTYSVNTCGKYTGNYIFPVNNAIADVFQGAVAGIVRGVVRNATNTMGHEGACGAATFTQKIGNGITTPFNDAQAARVARFFYLANQALAGAGGAIAGGLAAEAVHLYNKYQGDIDRIAADPKLRLR